VISAEGFTERHGRHASHHPLELLDLA
jgi:hypothetical protein